MPAPLPTLPCYKRWNWTYPPAANYSGYTSYELEEGLAEWAPVAWRVCRKSNATRQDEPWQVFLKNHYRKRIETTFSGITN